MNKDDTKMFKITSQAILFTNVQTTKTKHKTINRMINGVFRIRSSISLPRDCPVFLNLTLKINLLNSAEKWKGTH